MEGGQGQAEANATAYPVDTGYGGIVDVPVEPVLIISECGVEVRQPEEEEAGKKTRCATYSGRCQRGADRERLR